jgi:hypothetical protein
MTTRNIDIELLKKDLTYLKKGIDNIYKEKQDQLEQILLKDNNGKKTDL